MLELEEEDELELLELELIELVDELLELLLDDELDELLELDELKSSIDRIANPTSGLLGPGNCNDPVLNRNSLGADSSPLVRVSTSFNSQI